MTLPSRAASLALAFALALAPAARADEGADRALVRGRYDVLSDTVQVTLRNETSFGIGRRDRVGNVTVPETSFLTLVGERWGLAHHIQLPLVWQPEVVARYGGIYGLGDLGYELYGTWLAGTGLAAGGGLALVLPTGSDRRTSESKWQIGPALALGGAWGAASLSVTARQLFTMGSVHTAPDVNRLVVQPVLTWTFRSGWYLVTAPRLQADWDAATSDRFTVPLGGGVGRIFGVSSQRLAVSLEAYANVAPRSSTPHADWSLRAGLSLLYPR
ncbi:MAG: hypothetical protein HZB56_08590 [Deltaproteobacteria bacterium]|nr:hypothetical protein [Deltaproteobacteria bacterium]